MTGIAKNASFRVRREVWICLLLVISTVAVYCQVAKFDFINLDTDLYVYENKVVKRGLTLNGIRWAFSTQHASNWHPLTWISHMMDIELHGLNSGRHHLTNVLFHIINTLLLFGLLRRMTGSVWRSGLVAALFALHPVHVESVAWIAERKDLLSTLFGLLAIWNYVNYARHARRGGYVLAMLFFALSLMAKPMMVTLPFGLLLLDFWPLKRIQFESPKQAGGPTLTRGSPGLPASLIVEKIPFIILSAASCVITFYAQKTGGAVVSLGLHPLPLRISNAVVAYAAYLGKMFWPENLAIFYPHPGIWSIRHVLAASLLLIAVTAVAVRFLKSQPWLIVGWLWYLGTLVPVIGLVQVGHQAMADRYTYIPLIGLFIAIAWGFGYLVKNWKYRKPLSVALGFAVIGVLMVLSWQQIGHWENSTTVFKHALEATENNSVAHNNYGLGLALKGQIPKAIEQFKIALTISPNSASARLNLGLALFEQNELEEARQCFEKVLQINSNDATAYNYLGKIQSRLGAPERAAHRFRQAIKINPEYADAYNNLGISLYRLGRADQALPQYLQAIKIKPSYFEAYNNAGAALIQLGEYNKAIAFFREAVRIAPDFVEAQNNLNKTLAALKSTHERSIINRN